MAWQTTGILSVAQYNGNIAYFFEDDHQTIKKNRYIKIWNGEDLNNDSYFVGYNSDTGTGGWWGAIRSISPIDGQSYVRPISMKIGLFGVAMSRHPMYMDGTDVTGAASSNTSFRPVIWN